MGAYLMKFMVSGCRHGYGQVTYGRMATDYEQAMKAYWHRGGRKVYDAIAASICIARAKLTQPLTTPEPQAPTTFERM